MRAVLCVLLTFATSSSFYYEDPNVLSSPFSRGEVKYIEIEPEEKEREEKEKKYIEVEEGERYIKIEGEEKEKKKKEEKEKEKKYIKVKPGERYVKYEEPGREYEEPEYEKPERREVKYVYEQPEVHVVHPDYYERREAEEERRHEQISNQMEIEEETAENRQEIREHQMQPQPRYIPMPMPMPRYPNMMQPPFMYHPSLYSNYVLSTSPTENDGLPTDGDVDAPSPEDGPDGPFPFPIPGRWQDLEWPQQEGGPEMQHLPLPHFEHFPHHEEPPRSRTANLRLVEAHEEYMGALHSFQKATDNLEAALHHYKVAQRVDEGEFPHLHPSHFDDRREPPPMPFPPMPFHFDDRHHIPGPHMHVHPMPMMPVGPPPMPMAQMVKPLPPMGPPLGPPGPQPMIVRPVMPHHIVHHHVHGGQPRMPPRGPMHPRGPRGPHMFPMRRQNANTIVQGQFVIKPTIVIPDNLDLAPIENWFEKQFPNFPAWDVEPRFPPIEHFSFPEGLLPPPPPEQAQPGRPITPVLIPMMDDHPPVFF